MFAPKPDFAASDVGRTYISRTEVGRTGCWIRVVDAKGKEDQYRQLVSFNMNDTHKIASFFQLFTRCDKVVPGLGATNLLLLLLLFLLLLIPVSEFLTTFWQLFDNFLSTFCNFLQFFENF
jgi:hypothetical protein